MTSSSGKQSRRSGNPKLELELEKLGAGSEGIEREEREEPASHSNRLIERESKIDWTPWPGRAGTEQPERESKI
jgi:hypothetical protein